MESMIKYIAASECITHYNIDDSFVKELIGLGLLDGREENGEVFFPEDQLTELEKFIRWHYDLNVNLEGIDIITDMLQQINSLHQEIRDLKNRLSVYR